jgi:GTPase SAR1 family protein
MGNCGGKGSDAAGEHNKKLDKKIKEDGNMTNKEIKLLLLGSGESGKSKKIRKLIT